MLAPDLRHAAKRRLQESVSDEISRIQGSASEEHIQQLIEAEVEKLVRFAPGVEEADKTRLVAEAVSDFLHYGPIDPLLADKTISEIMVNGGGVDEQGKLLPHKVFIERNGAVERRNDIVFEDDAHVVRIMNRILSRQGRHIDDANPVEDATLPDGSRFNGTIYPVAPDGSTFNIRMFRDDALTPEAYVRFGTATWRIMGFLATAVAAKCSILISGGTGSGKTTLLNILAGYIPADERIITIEDTCELLVHKTHEDVVRLEARKPNQEGEGEVTLDTHLKSALRKRPDRIIVGECRGAEAYTMLEAMSTGHDGSMTTIHANDAVAAITRLETLVKQGDATLSEETILQKIAGALDLVVQIQRMSDGSRRIVEVQAINGYVDGCVQHLPLFRFVREGIDAATGELKGHFESLGAHPMQVKAKIEAEGYEYKPDWFVEGSEVSA